MELIIAGWAAGQLPWGSADRPVSVSYPGIPVIQACLGSLSAAILPTHGSPLDHVCLHISLFTPPVTKMPRVHCDSVYNSALTPESNKLLFSVLTGGVGSESHPQTFFFFCAMDQFHVKHILAVTMDSKYNSGLCWMSLQLLKCQIWDNATSSQFWRKFSQPILLSIDEWWDPGCDYYADG